MERNHAVETKDIIVAIGIVLGFVGLITGIAFLTGNI